MTQTDSAPATRQHIATALRAVHDLDLTLCAYAGAGHCASLSAALSHARAIVAALETERRPMWEPARRLRRLRSPNQSRRTA